MCSSRLPWPRPPASTQPSLPGWPGADMTVLTFDYRGTSATPSELRRETADLLTWAGDAAAALEHLLDDAPAGNHSPVTWIGHSFGGQVLPFVRHDLLDSAVLVATGNGHYHHNPPWLRRRAPLLWRGIVPLTTAVAGYFPGRRLGILGDLPTGVARQWGRWCMHPDYWGADVRDIAARQALITHPVTLVSTSDDPLVTRSGPAALARALSEAPVSIVELSPEQLAVDSDRAPRSVPSRACTCLGGRVRAAPAARPAWPQRVPKPEPTTPAESRVNRPTEGAAMTRTTTRQQHQQGADVHLRPVRLADWPTHPRVGPPTRRHPVPGLGPQPRRRDT